MPNDTPGIGTGKPLLTAQLSDVTTLVTLLRSVALCPHAIITASEDGLEVVTELNRTIQAHAYLYATLFDTYEFIAPPRKRRTSHAQGGAHPSKRARPHADLATSSSPSSSSQEIDQLASHAQHDRDGVGREGDENADDEDDDEPPSISFEVNLQTWLSCLSIFGGVNPIRPLSGALHSSRPYTSTAFTSTSTSSTSSFRQRDRDRDRADEDEHGAAQGSSTGAQGGDGQTTSMSLSYRGTGHPLTLELWQDAKVVTTRCEIATYEATYLTDLTFDTHYLTGQVILPSHVLHSAFGELESSCSRLGVYIQPSSIVAATTESMSASTGQNQRAEETAAAGRGEGGKLKLKAVGDTGESEMVFPHHPTASAGGSGVMEKFLSTTESRTWWYPFGLVGKVMGCLKSSLKTSMRIDEQGLCSLQFMLLLPPATSSTNTTERSRGTGVPSTTSHPQIAKEYAFVEVLCVPLDDTLL